MNHYDYEPKNSHFSGQPASLLFPRGSDIRILGLDGNDTGSYDIIAHSQAAMSALGIWWEQHLVFWTDLKQGTIKRAKIPGKAFWCCLPGLFPGAFVVFF